MTAYEELLEFGGERIFDFLKNARLHESQFKYSEFNEVCYKKMYIENNQDSIKTVKELKEEIPELKDTCKGCGSYFMNPRNKSIKGLDVQFGRLLEDVIIDFLKTKYKLNVTHGYCGEPYLFMDELKQDSLPFELLLTITQGYRSQIHCRYSNCITLWNEVHITSIFSPEDIYAGVVSRENQGKDTIKQLLRRITKYVYHYKVGDEYKAYELAGDQYIDFDDLKRRATGTEFMQIDDEDIPFD